jgi:hypothetical protein
MPRFATVCEKDPVLKNLLGLAGQEFFTCSHCQIRTTVRAEAAEKSSEHRTSCPCYVNAEEAARLQSNSLLAIADDSTVLRAVQQSDIVEQTGTRIEAQSILLPTFGGSSSGPPAAADSVASTPTAERDGLPPLLQEGMYRTKLAKPHYRVAARAVVRSGHWLDSDYRFNLEVGEVLAPLEERLTDGVPRVRFAGGWVSRTARDGTAMLQPTDAPVSTAIVAASLSAPVICGASRPVAEEESESAPLLAQHASTPGNYGSIAPVQVVGSPHFGGTPPATIDAPPDTLPHYRVLQKTAVDQGECCGCTARYLEAGAVITPLEEEKTDGGMVRVRFAKGSWVNKTARDGTTILEPTDAPATIDSKKKFGAAAAAGGGGLIIWSSTRNSGSTCNADQSDCGDYCCYGECCDDGCCDAENRRMLGDEDVADGDGLAIAFVLAAFLLALVLLVASRVWKRARNTQQKPKDEEK